MKDHPLHATAASAVSLLGMIEPVRDYVHQLAGIFGDICGMLISFFTLAYWVLLWRDKGRGRK